MGKNKMIPRGIRNNNPGNLVITRIPWKGKVPVKQNTDGVFEQFRDYAGVKGIVWGIRAMMMDLRGDIVKDGTNTIRKLLTEYSKTDLESYIKTTCKITGFKEGDVLLGNEGTICDLIAAFSFVENGGYYITEQQIKAAWEML